eukprot:c43066_g1_i1 orf=13-204(+)
MSVVLSFLIKSYELQVSLVQKPEPTFILYYSKNSLPSGMPRRYESLFSLLFYTMGINLKCPLC